MPYHVFHPFNNRLLKLLKIIPGAVGMIICLTKAVSTPSLRQASCSNK